MARLAAQRCTKLESAAFANIAERIRQIAQQDDAAAYMRIDGEFNALLGTACRNE
jgi:DNA-binding GntR family transcriptional regulator